MQNSSNRDLESGFLKKLDIFSVVIGLLGFFVSLYALALHLQIISNSGGSAICDINATVSCSGVVGSSYGEFLSIPLGAYGMAYFAILLSAAFLPKFAQVNKKWLIQLQLLLGGVGAFVALGLAYISYFILGLVCPTCTITQFLVIVFFIAKLFQYIRLKNQKSKAQQDAFIRFLAVSLCLALPPIAAGLFSPFFANLLIKTDKAPKQVQVESTKPIQVVSKENESEQQAENALKTFNKTNFVGNGEDYRRGNDNAKIIVQVFSDFGCPHCKTATKNMADAQDAVGINNVVIVYRFFPISNKCNPFIDFEGAYPFTCELSEASRCAGQQGKFWEFKSWAFDGQEWSDAKRAQEFSLNGLKEQAKKLNLNVETFTQCLENHTELQKLKDDAKIGQDLGIDGTPLIYINGVKYSGNHSVSSFVQEFSSRLK